MDELWLGCAQSPAEAAQCDAHPDMDRDPPHVPRPALAPAAVPLSHRGEERGIYRGLLHQKLSSLTSRSNQCNALVAPSLLPSQSFKLMVASCCLYFNI